MAYYNVCPHCGSNLDPGEKCDCKEESKKLETFYRNVTKTAQKTGQLSFVLDKKEVAGYACKVVR